MPQIKYVLPILFLTTIASQAMADWRCEVDRCKEYQNCSLNGNSMGCSYNSSSAISGAIEFENGEIILIDWATDFFDADGNLIDEPLNGYFAFANNIRRLFMIERAGCVQFPTAGDELSFSYGLC